MNAGARTETIIQIYFSRTTMGFRILQCMQFNCWGERCGPWVGYILWWFAYFPFFLLSLKSLQCIHATLPITGFAASGFYDAKAASTDTLCLPHDPDAAPVGLPFSDAYGRIYGSEYEFNFKNIAVNDDVPCAVCYTTQAVSIMIPAKTSCPSSWTKQYAGFLTSGGYYTDQYGNEYLCIDGDPEYLTDGARRHNENGRLFYPVHSVCGSLPCPPYKDSQNLGCVVCTN